MACRLQGTKAILWTNAAFLLLDSKEQISMKFW